MKVREIHFHCQNVNIYLSPSALTDAAFEAMPKQLPNLKMTCPQGEYTNLPEMNLPQNLQPGYPIKQTPEFPQLIDPEVASPIYPEGSLPSPISGSFSEQLEASIFSLVNAERTTQGLPALRLNDALADVARRKSLKMGDLGYFSHTAPDGTTTADWLRSEGHAFSGWGENIANFGANATAEEIMSGWMNSAGHRANILNHNFTLLGVGVYQIDGRTFATQVFGR